MRGDQIRRRSPSPYEKQREFLRQADNSRARLDKRERESRQDLFAKEDQARKAERENRKPLDVATQPLTPPRSQERQRDESKPREGKWNKGYMNDKWEFLESNSDHPGQQGYKPVYRSQSGDHWWPRQFWAQPNEVESKPYNQRYNKWNDNSLQKKYIFQGSVQEIVQRKPQSPARSFQSPARSYQPRQQKQQQQQQQLMQQPYRSRSQQPQRTIPEKPPEPMTIQQVAFDTSQSRLAELEFEGQEKSTDQPDSEDEESHLDQGN